MRLHTTSVDAHMGRRGVDALCRAIWRDVDKQADPRQAKRLQRLHRGPEIPFAGLCHRTIVDLTRHHDRSLDALDDRATWELAVRSLWSAAPHRESRYAAVTLIRMPRYRTYASSPLSTSLYRELILDRPTRDTVDAVATLCLPLPLDAHPDTETRVLRSWACVGSVWVRRAAILCQLRRGSRTDRELLRCAIGSNLKERDAIVREAIPEALAAYVESHPDAEGWLHDTLASWSAQMPTCLARAIDVRLGTREHS